MPSIDSSYRAPQWLPGGHLQTVYPYLLRQATPLGYRRERMATPDGDFLDVDWICEQAEHGRADQAGADHARDDRAPADRRRHRQAENRPASDQRRVPLVVLMHGLEGSSRSHYAVRLMRQVAARGWRGAVAHWRGCSGSANLLPRAYHSGDHAEAAWLATRFAEASRASPVFVVGVSLGGSALLNWLGRAGDEASRLVTGAAAVSAPIDLVAAGHAIDRGVNRVYSSHFLATLIPKALAMAERHPGLIDADRVRRARTFRDFDDWVTAPLHGFAGVIDYWTRASSRPWLGGIRVPTLVLNARNDPLVPGDSLPGSGEAARSVVLEQPAEGGHVGFLSPPFPGDADWLARRLLGFFDELLAGGVDASAGALRAGGEQTRCTDESVEAPGRTAPRAEGGRMGRGVWFVPRPARPSPRCTGPRPGAARQLLPVRHAYPCRAMITSAVVRPSPHPPSRRLR